MSTPLQTFKFEMPVSTFEKSGASDRSWRIGGFVSTDHMDRQMEVLLQDGLDFTPFMKSGYFNDNHSPSSADVLGYPESAELREMSNGHRGWYVEGYLLQQAPKAQSIWGICKSLAGTGRQYGFSVEGRILDRDPANPGLVRKAEVLHVAITHCPINTMASLSVLAKSLSAGHAAPSIGTVASGTGAASIISPESVNGMTAEDHKRLKRRLIKKSDALGYLIAQGIPPKMAHDAVESALVGA